MIRDNSKKSGDLEAIAEVIKQLSARGVLEVTLFGGEPFLHSQIIELGELVRKHGMRPGFVTNGDVEVGIKRVAEVFPQGSVSIHGPEKVHDRLVGKRGAWKNSLSFIERYTKAGGEASVCITVSENNANSVSDFCHFLLGRIPLISIVLNPVIPFGEIRGLGRESFLKLARAAADLEGSFLKKGSGFVFGATVPFCVFPPEAAHLSTVCLAGSLFATVDYGGDLYICAERHNSIGNILREDIKSLWTSSPEFKMLATASFAGGECRNCVAYSWCIGGCRSTKQGDVPTVDPRAIGCDAAMKNLEAVRRRNVGGRQKKQDLPAKIRVAKGVRSRKEEFGMYVLTPKGQPLALDNTGRVLFQKLFSEQKVDWKVAAISNGLAINSVARFVRQGVQLGVFS